MALPHVVLGVLPPAPVERNYTPPHLKHRPASLAEMRAENLTPDSNCNFCGAIDTMIRKLVEAKLPSITQLARRHFGAELVSCYHRGLWAAQLGPEGGRFAKSTGAVL